MGKNKKSKRGQKKEIDCKLEQQKKPLDNNNNLEQQKELEARFKQNLKKSSENLEDLPLDSKSSLSTEDGATSYKSSITEPKTSPKRPTITKNGPAIYDVVISHYAYDQTEKNIKILVEMPGIGGYPKDKISLTASEFSFRFYVKGFDNKNCLLVVHCLAHEIIPSDVDFIVKKDKVILVLPKKNHFKWVCLTPTEDTLFEEWSFIFCGTVRQILGQGVTIDLENIWLIACHDRRKLSGRLLDPVVHYEKLGFFKGNLKWRTLEDVMNYAKKMIPSEPLGGKFILLLGSALLMSLVQRNKRLNEDHYANIEKKITQLPCNPDDKLNKPSSEEKANKPCIIETYQNTLDPQRTILTPPVNLDEISMESVTDRLVPGLEERGQSCFDDKQYQAAIEIYSEIIKLFPKASNGYSRRASCHLKLKKYQEALDDGRMALLKNPKDIEGCLVVGESLIALGKPREALKILQKAKKFDSGNKNVENVIAIGNKLSREVMKAEEAFDKDDFDAAAAFYKTAIKSAVSSRMLQLKTAECLILADKVDKVNEIVGNLAGGRITESDAHCIRGMIHFYQDEKHETFEQFDLCLTLEESHARCLELYQISRDIYFTKERGNKYFKNGKYSLALHSYVKGMNISHKNKKVKATVHFDIGLTNLKLLNVADAIKNFTSAINLNGKYEKALLKRAECYCELNQYREAVQDFETICKHSPNSSNKELLRNAKIKLKTSRKAAVDFCSLSKDKQDQSLALIKKEKGNELFSKGKYEEALELYSMAVKLDPSCPACYETRSACLSKLNRFSDSLKDAAKSIELDENYLKGHLQKGKIQLILGKGEEAIRTFHQGLKIDPLNKDFKTEQSKASEFIRCKKIAEDAFQKQDFREAEKYFGKVLDTAIGCSEIIIKYVEAGIYFPNKSFKISELKGRLQCDVPNYHYISALEIFHNYINVQSVENNMKNVIKELESVLNLDPNHSKAKELKIKAQQICQFYSEGQKARARNNLAEAIALFQKALLVDEFSKKLNGETLCEIGECFMMQTDFIKAIEQFKLSIELNPYNVLPYINRAKCYDHLKRWQESVSDYEKACDLDPFSSVNKKLLRDAKLKLKKSTSARKDYYRILELDSNATTEAIKKAYIRLAKEHHPDRLSGEDAKIKLIGEEKFKEINKAYTILIDPLKRERYDREEETSPMFDPGSFFFNLFGFRNNFYSSHNPFYHNGYDYD